MRLLADIKEQVRPSLQEQKIIKKESKEIISTIKKQIKEKAVVILGGSLAKGTNLSGEITDIDIYVSYPAKYEKDVSTLLEKKLKKVFSKIKRLHGSRDYFQIKKGKIMIEVVPLIKITKTEQAKNITDISPLHTQWVKKNLTEKQKDEVRLLKAWCHANDIYGAESHIKGLSGYVCEILIKKYGSFLTFLKQVKSKNNLFIDIEKYYRNQLEAKRELNVAKIQGPMIVIDPVQKERNAASAVSDEVFTTLKKTASKFLKKPSQTYFIIKEQDITALKKTKKGKERMLICSNKKGKQDVVGAKALKAKQYVEKELRKKGFNIKSGISLKKKNIIWFEADEKKLSAYEIKKGPPVALEKYAKEFKKKYKNTKEKKKILYAKVKREQRTLKEVIKTLMKEKYIVRCIGHGSIL